MGLKVVVGVAGGGKTSYGMDLIKDALQSGIRWSEIGFSSFSRAACREAADRAAAVTGEDPDTLAKTGWFRTIHSAALRSLGVDTKCVLDHNSADGKKFLKEALGCERGGEPGTQADIVDKVLSAWDLCRARLTLLPDRNDVLNGLFGQTQMTHLTHQNPLKPTQNPPTDTKFHYGVRDVSSCADNGLRREEGVFSGPIAYMGQFSISSQQELVRGDFGGFGGSCENNPIGSKDLRKPTKSESGVRWWVKVGQGHQNGQPQQFRSDEMRALEKIHKNEQVIIQYERHKRMYGRLDYTDILFRIAGVQVTDDLAFVQDHPLGNPPEEITLWIFDEFQDSSPLLAYAAERLSEAAESIVLMGDDRQAVYGFSGAYGAIFRGLQKTAGITGQRIILNRSWRNTDSVIDWGERVNEEDGQYESRRPFGEAGEGSVGLLDYNDLLLLLPKLADTDTMIVSRAWFSLLPIIKCLDDLAIPWTSTQEDHASKWNCPAKIAFTLIMKDLAAGKRISEHDFRRITEDVPSKLHGSELLIRGTKAKWKKLECSQTPKRTLHELKDWGATENFVDYVLEGNWRHNMPLLIDSAITRYGVQAVRKPRLQLGSVHSVKGLEARNVFCLSESTQKIAAESDPDEERCLKYVAITRSSMHYRLVVNRLDISRGKPLFWAAPQDAKEYFKFDDPGEVGSSDSESFRVGNPETDHPMDEESEDLDREIPWGDLRDHWNARPDPLCDGETGSDRGEKNRCETIPDAGESPAGDQEEWWNL